MPYRKTSTGEMLAEKIGYHGHEINICQIIVEVAGHMDQQARFLIELTLLEIEFIQI
jgi:hypothetical protein